MDKLFTIKDQVAILTAYQASCVPNGREMARRGARVVVMSTAQEQG